MKTIISNKLLEFNFALFPIWILPTYFLLKSVFPSPELSFLIFIILLGETHFASTFLFYFDQKNNSYIKNNKFIIIYIPLFLAVLFFLFGLKYFKFALLLSAIASGIHVTRQSIGISRIYGTHRNNFFEFLIYFSSFSFLIVGFLRFYYQDYSSFILSVLPIDIKEFVKYSMIIINNKIITISVVTFFSILAIQEKTDYKKKLSNLCGVLLYSPYLFVNHIYDAIVIGVGAHWSQYLILNYKIYFHQKKFDLNKKIQILFILSYAIIMGSILYKYYFNISVIEIMILVPLTSQFFHYYVDAFIWRFSVKEIRDSIGSRLFSN